MVGAHVAGLRKAAQCAVERAFAAASAAVPTARSRPRAARTVGKRRAGCELSALGERFFEALSRKPGETMVVLGGRSRSVASGATASSVSTERGRTGPNRGRALCEGIRHPKHGGVDLTGPMRTGRAARVRAGFGRAALSNPNGATSRTARRAPPRRPGPSVAAPLFVEWDGIGSSQAISRRAMGRSSRGKVEAVEDCRKQAHRPG